jgi:spore coat polysaccharide biosynthesis predicted glycosyltransferase SpsG/RimJ/RimL family protein N-acetyltransferase
MQPPGGRIVLLRPNAAIMPRRRESLVHVLIHCHGGPAVGVGHVFRAASLAEAAVGRGHRVDFSGTFEGPLVTGRLRSAGMEIVADARLAAYDVVHVDTYRPDGDDLAARAAGVALLSNLEDGEFGRRPADLVIDPNLGAEGTRRDIGPVLLRGSRWAPLRRSVVERAAQATIRDEARRVLVVMGGTDVHGVTAEVLEVLAATGRDLTVTAIAQPASREELERKVAVLDLDVELVGPRPDLADLMLDQDLVVSASGTSVWELCCLGVPAALVCVSDNQRDSYARVLERGAAVGLGSAMSGLDRDAAAATLGDALADAGLRDRLSKTAGRLVDGLGAWRVVRSWEQLTGRHGGRQATAGLQMRPVTEADAETLLVWRNDPATRSASRTTGELGIDQHRAWLSRALDDPDRHLLVASDDAGDVGTVRWDRLRQGEWEVSVTVAPERRGQALAGRLLRSGESWLADNDPATHTMLATVHEGNVPSLRMLDSSGYLPEGAPGEDGLLRVVRQRVPTG